MLDHSDVQVLRATYIRQGLHLTDPVFGILNRMDRVLALRDLKRLSKAAVEHEHQKYEDALKEVHKLMEGKPKLYGVPKVHRTGE